MGQLEHIAPILFRALKDLEKSWETQTEEEVESKDEDRIITANQT